MPGRKIFKSRFLYDRPGRAANADSGFNYTERHLKCVWFSPELRPADLRTSAGEIVVVEKPGRWNLEKGPDFLNASLVIGHERRRITGDVEVHVHPADWRRHGHLADSAYAGVIAHVTYFPGRLPAEVLPRRTLQIALKNGLISNPCFSFESIDLTSFPFALRKAETPCFKIISSRSPEDISSLLWAAGSHRLQKKADLLAGAVAQRGEEQVLYEEIMSALGYKHNRVPFRRLAERLPLEMLREDSRLDPVSAYALLAGVSGLLPSVAKTRWDSETRKFVQRLWSYWWKQQAKWSSAVMPADAWCLSSIRPQNHPRRRLMAAALLFTERKSLAEKIDNFKTDNARQWLEQIMDIFINCDDVLTGHDQTYWRRRLALGRKPSTADIALIGRARAAAIVSNIIVPFLMGTQKPLPPFDDLFINLPGEEDNVIIRQTAFNLLGPDHNPALYRNGLLQQGLIQIFHDFCLNDRTNCAECGLLKMMQ